MGMKNVVAVGECGLDYSSKNNVEKGIQEIVFKAQLDLARKMNKPICLHIREADDDAWRILEEVQLDSNHQVCENAGKISLQ